MEKIFEVIENATKIKHWKRLGRDLTKHLFNHITLYKMFGTK